MPCVPFTFGLHEVSSDPPAVMAATFLAFRPRHVPKCPPMIHCAFANVAAWMSPLHPTRQSFEPVLAYAIAALPLPATPRTPWLPDVETVRTLSVGGLNSAGPRVPVGVTMAAVPVEEPSTCVNSPPIRRFPSEKGFAP